MEDVLPTSADDAQKPSARRVPKAPEASSVATRHSMQANKSRDTKPELLVRKFLRDAGLGGYRLQWKKAAGRPDVTYPGKRIAVFVNGCFWHRCPYCNPSTPRTNSDFWGAKFERNLERDAQNHERLMSDGWTVVVVWECRLKKRRLTKTMQQVTAEVRHAARDTRDGEGHMVVVGRVGVRGSRGLAATRVRKRCRCRHGLSHGEGAKR